MNQSLQSQYSTANYGGASAAGGASLKVKLNQLEVRIYYAYYELMFLDNPILNYCML